MTVPEETMRTFDVGIAVTGTVHVTVDAVDADSAMDQGEAKFSDNFDYYIQQVDPKACSAEDAEEIQ